VDVRPSELPRLRGDEAIAGTSYAVLEFWRWALGDLRMNNARGHLVEYLVARAVGDEAPLRVEWGPYDARAPDGTLIEVKASGYLQSWALRKLSTPSWSFPSVMANRVWSEALGDYVTVDPADRVHVWVFALQTCQEPAEYDPLTVAQWEFRVLSHRRLLATGQKSARLSFFDRLNVRPVTYEHLAQAVSDAREDHESLAAAGNGG
jgi:hypothetical protein